MPTPSPRAPINGYEGDTPDDINQLLGTQSQHVVLSSAQAAAIGVTQAQLDYWQSLSQPLAVDQPVALSGEIDRVLLPISIASGEGQDVLVSLFADSGGFATGVPLAQTLVPKEWLSSVPSATDVLLTPPFFSQQQVSQWLPQASLPVALSATGVVGNEANIFVIGGNNGTAAVATVYCASLGDIGEIDVWTVGAALPAAVQSAGVAIQDANIFVAGGIAAGVYSTAVYIGAISDNTIANWQSAAALPVATSGPLLVVFTDTTGAQWLYSIGGTTGTGATAAVYIASINSGQIGSWALGTPLPVAGNVWGGVVGGNIFVAGAGNAWMLDGNSPNAWIPVPITTSTTLAGSAVIGDTVYQVGGTVGGNAVASVFSLPTNSLGDVARGFLN